MYPINTQIIVKNMRKKVIQGIYTCGEYHQNNNIIVWPSHRFAWMSCTKFDVHKGAQFGSFGDMELVFGNLQEIRAKPWKIWLTFTKRK